MIAMIKGVVFEVGDNLAIVEVQGMGYELNCSQNTLGDFSVGDSVMLWVYTHVREDLFQLFGFSKKTEKALFESLIKINGIGPKVAIRLLSGCRVDRFITMVESSDVKGLMALPKIGKKTAEQIILSLKGKLVIDSIINSKHRNISSALVNLGFKLAAVEQFISDLPIDTVEEDGIRQGLAVLTET